MVLKKIAHRKPQQAELEKMGSYWDNIRRGVPSLREERKEIAAFLQIVGACSDARQKVREGEEDISGLHPRIRDFILAEGKLDMLCRYGHGTEVDGDGNITVHILDGRTVRVENYLSFNDKEVSLEAALPPFGIDIGAMSAISKSKLVAHILKDPELLRKLEEKGIVVKTKMVTVRGVNSAPTD